MSHAKSDLITAEKLSDDTTSDIRARVFHSQQAAEKAMKAVIAASGRKPEWTHNLIVLEADLPDGCSAGVSSKDIATLTGYETASRYGSTEITKEEADAALNIARTVMDSMRTSL